MRLFCRFARPAGTVLVCTQRLRDHRRKLLFGHRRPPDLDPHRRAITRSYDPYPCPLIPTRIARRGNTRDLARADDRPGAALVRYPMQPSPAPHRIRRRRNSAPNRHVASSYAASAPDATLRNRRTRTKPPHPTAHYRAPPPRPLRTRPAWAITKPCHESSHTGTNRALPCPAVTCHQTRMTQPRPFRALPSSPGTSAIRVTASSSASLKASTSPAPYHRDRGSPSKPGESW